MANTVSGAGYITGQQQQLQIPTVLREGCVVQDRTSPHPFLLLPSNLPPPPHTLKLFWVIPLQTHHPLRIHWAASAAFALSMYLPLPQPHFAELFPIWPGKSKSLHMQGINWEIIDKQEKSGWVQGNPRNSYKILLPPVSQMSSPSQCFLSQTPVSLTEGIISHLRLVLTRPSMGL
jgi:hypothetical protein